MAFFPQQWFCYKLITVAGQKLHKDSLSQKAANQQPHVSYHYEDNSDNARLKSFPVNQVTDPTPVPCGIVQTRKGLADQSKAGEHFVQLRSPVELYKHAKVWLTRARLVSILCKNPVMKLSPRH